MKQEYIERGSLFPRAEWLTGYEDPFRFQNPDDFKRLILETLAHDVSDIFIQPDLPILVNINGDLVAITHRTVDGDEVRNLLKWASGRDTAVTDIVSGVPVNSRFELFDPIKKDERGASMRYGYRVNGSAIDGHGGTSAQVVMRPIPGEPLKFDRIGLHEDLVRASIPRDGIVYIAGATGSGKTTTIASIIRYILENDTPIKGNIVTHEEPIEFTFRTIHSSHSIVVQSQVPMHFKSFYEANREAMRRKPGAALVGELRDSDTIRAGVELSLTGHPVYGTVHANKVAAIPRRLISRFPETERATVIFDIIETARFMMAQRLVKGVKGRRVAAREYLEFDDEVKDALINLTDMGKVTDCLQQLVDQKGHSFQKEAERLLNAGEITEKVAQELLVG